VGGGGGQVGPQHHLPLHLGSTKHHTSRTSLSSAHAARRRRCTSNRQPAAPLRRRHCACIARAVAAATAAALGKCADRPGQPSHTEGALGLSGCCCVPSVLPQAASADCSNECGVVWCTGGPCGGTAATGILRAGVYVWTPVARQHVPASLERVLLGPSVMVEQV
jgi:hypothetical protein